MGPSSGVVRVRTVRADGTPVYRYEDRPGTPAVSVHELDSERGPADRHAEATQPHAHDFLTLVHVERGAGSLRVDAADVVLEAGDVLAIAPGRVLDVGGVDGRAWATLFLPDAVPALAGVSPLTWARHPLLAPFVPDGGTDVRAVAPGDRSRWAAWFAELQAETRAPERVGAGEAVSALLTRMLVGLARLTGGAPSGTARGDALVDRVLAAIEDGFRDPIGTGDVARALGYTPGHLTTVVRERTGRTVGEWITERRLSEARRLLAETDLPLVAVAQRTGHQDAGYLARRFKERYGTTPVRWRRAGRTPDPPA